MCITSVHRVSTGSKRLTFTTSIRCVTCCFTICYIGCNGKDGSCREAISVGVMSSYCCHEFVYDFLCDLIYTVIIVTIFREVTCCLEVNDDSVFVSDRLNLSILDSR